MAHAAMRVWSPARDVKLAEQAAGEGGAEAAEDEGGSPASKRRSQLPSLTKTDDGFQLVDKAR